MNAADLPPGAHLVTPRLGYRHHGLYVGGGRVLHYGGLHRGWRRGPVEEVTLAQFARGRGFAVVRSGAARFDAATALERARSRLGENRYRLWSNNCEHFVNWALDGEARSAQVERWQRRAARLRAAWQALLGRAGVLGALGSARALAALRAAPAAWWRPAGRPSAL